MTTRTDTNSICKILTGNGIRLWHKKVYCEKIDDKTNQFKMYTVYNDANLKQLKSELVKCFAKRFVKSNFALSEELHHTSSKIENGDFTTFTVVLKN